MRPETNEFHRKFTAYPTKTALIFNDSEISYAQLARNIDAYARDFAAKGVKAADIVGVMLPNSPSFIYSLYALWRIGATVVPLNILYRKDELRHIIEDAGMKAIVTNPDMTGKLFDFEGVGFKSNLVYIDTASFHSATYATTTDIAIMVYTSGTTSKPKGVMLTFDNLHQSMVSMISAVNQSNNDVVILTLPLFHIFGLTLTLLTTLFVGGTAVVVKIFDANQVIDDIEKYNVNIFPAVPTMFIYLLQSPHLSKEKLKSLKFCLSGGSALSEKVVNEFENKTGIPIIEGYGLSEASPLVSINPLQGERKIGSVGLPAKDIEVKIIDEKYNEVEPGNVGEIIVKGKNIMKGYFNLPDITASTLRSGYLHTGDLGCFDKDGYLYIVGRKKDLIITNGYNVFPKEVESVLLKKREILETAVIGVPDDVSGEKVVAYVVLKNTASCSKEEISEFCSYKIASFKCPKKIIMVSDLPKNVTGKILRRELRDHYHINIERKTLPGILQKEIFFESSGATLCGRLFLPQNIVNPVPVFVLLCGIGGRKEWFEPSFPNDICKRGVALFTFDFRGHHPSTGCLDAQIGADLPAAINHLKKIQDIDPNNIFIGGQCLGALLCNQYAAENENIKGVANISVFLPQTDRGIFTERENNKVFIQIAKSKTHFAKYDADGFFKGYAQYLRPHRDFKKISSRPAIVIHYNNDPVSPSFNVHRLLGDIEQNSIRNIFLDSAHTSWISEVEHAISYDDQRISSEVGKWLEETIKFLKSNPPEEQMDVTQQPEVGMIN